MTQILNLKRRLIGHPLWDHSGAASGPDHQDHGSFDQFDGTSCTFCTPVHVMPLDGSLFSSRE
jgi:hypothetical protein